MKKFSAKEIIIPTIALFAICLVASVLLAFTNSITAPEIENQAKIAVQNGLKEVVTEVDGTTVASYSDGKDVEEGITVYDALDDKGETIAVVVTSSAKGYGGDVQVMTAYNTKAEIIGFTVVSCADETPGLGQNSKTHFTKDFFNGKSGVLKVEKDGGDVQAITAATITSRAVVSAVNLATTTAEKYLAGELTNAGETDAPAETTQKGGQNNG